MKKRIGVGIIGVQPGRSWGAVAHIPALKALSHEYEVIGIVNSSLESAGKAAAAFGIPKAFGNLDEMLASPEIELVIITVKVPRHFEIASAALKAGKHVFCEWPLANGYDEARELAELARKHSLVGAVGTQARVAPEVLYARDLIREGYVGEVLSSTLVGVGASWGSAIDEANAYTLDATNGATMQAIPLAHTLAAVQDVLGKIVEVSALMTIRQPKVHLLGSERLLDKTAADQVLVNGLFENGVPIAIHYRGGLSRGTGLRWEINGSEGDLIITAPIGHMQLADLHLTGANGGDKEVHPLKVPEKYLANAHSEGLSKNVGSLLALTARDIRRGTDLAPNFAYALGLHRLVDAIEQAAATGGRILPDAMGR